MWGKTCGKERITKKNNKHRTYLKSFEMFLLYVSIHAGHWIFQSYRDNPQRHKNCQCLKILTTERLLFTLQEWSFALIPHLLYCLPSHSIMRRLPRN